MRPVCRRPEAVGRDPKPPLLVGNTACLPTVCYSVNIGAFYFFFELVMTSAWFSP